MSASSIASELLAGPTVAMILVLLVQFRRLTNYAAMGPDRA